MKHALWYGVRRNRAAVAWIRGALMDVQHLGGGYGAMIIWIWTVGIRGRVPTINPLCRRQKTFNRSLREIIRVNDMVL
jgi:hypothetical protein